MGATFLNTDLTIKARFDLRPLVTTFTERGLILVGDVPVKGGVWRATLETELSRPTPEQAATVLLNAIETLDDVQRSSWQKCFSRCLDFGYECCDETFESTNTLSNQLLTRIAQAGATIAFTVYRDSSRVLENTVRQKVQGEF